MNEDLAEVPLDEDIVPDDEATPDAFRCRVRCAASEQDGGAARYRRHVVGFSRRRRVKSGSRRDCRRRSIA